MSSTLGYCVLQVEYSVREPLLPNFFISNMQFHIYSNAPSSNTMATSEPSEPEQHEALLRKCSEHCAALWLETHRLREENGQLRHIVTQQYHELNNHAALLQSAHTENQELQRSMDALSKEVVTLYQQLTEMQTSKSAETWGGTKVCAPWWGDACQGLETVPTPLVRRTH